MTPIERAARAVAARRGQQLADRGASSKPVDQYADERWGDHVADVRATVQAIREPSQVMMAAGRSSPINENLVGYNAELTLWRAMVDAALDESADDEA